MRLPASGRSHNSKDMKSSSLGRVLIAQTQVVFNDNAAKLLLVGLAQMALPEDQAKLMVSLVAVLLVLPFVFLSPTCGWLADRYPKRDVLWWGLILQVAAMLLLCVAIAAQSITIAVGCFILLAIQSAIFSPAKQGILKELVGSGQLGSAVAWMEMLTISAILVGSLAGGLLIDEGTRSTGNPFSGGLLGGGILLGACLLALLLFRGVRSDEPRSTEPFSVSLFWKHFYDLGELWHNKPLRLAALGISFFYAIGGIFFLILVEAGREAFGGDVGSATLSGWLMTVLGAGIATGAMSASFVSRGRIELGTIPIGAIGMPLCLLLMSLPSPGSLAFQFLLLGFGFFGGWFIVPLNAFLQDRAEDARRGRILAAANILSSLGGVIAVVVQMGLSSLMPVWGQVLVLAFATAAAAIYVAVLLPDSMFRLLLMLVSGIFYRVRGEGLENLPKGGALLVCNHVSYVDAIILQLSSPRPIRFLSYEGFFKVPVMGTMLRIMKTIPISSTHAKDAIRETAQRIEEGELVCIFPEGRLTRTGKLLGFRKGFELMARKANAPVVPVYLDSLWGSIFSFEGNRYFFKIPRSLPYKVTVRYGKAMDCKKADSLTVRQSIMDLGAEAFMSRRDLGESLGYALIKGLNRRPSRRFLSDCTGAKTRHFTRGQVLAFGLALGLQWREGLKGRRIGIALPPGIGATLANLAIVFSGKIPVNLNLTTGEDAARACLRKGEISTIITSPKVQSRFKEFPWTSDVVPIEREIEAIPNVLKAAWLMAAYVLPPDLITQLARIPLKGGEEEAVLLFTSGSSGEPKGVALTHRNVLSNTCQVSEINAFEQDDNILACLPLFHSFGLTFTLWYPLLTGCRFTAVASPLDSKKIASAAQEEKATILLATPTFLKSYARRAKPEEFASVRLAVAGAEKLPVDLLDLYQEKYNIPIMEGYGLTETSPVCSVNIPDPLTIGQTEKQTGRKIGSVGQLLPGMTARILNPDTNQELPLNSTGLLALRGPNIFSGYLGQPEKSREVLRDGWFITGDLARFDDEGFLFIEGRLSRFSKIGGEMVPHGKVEEIVNQALGIDTSAAPSIAVMGVPDEAKGEALVLLTTQEIDADSLREKLPGLGAPNLWIPRIIHRVGEIPILGTGKLDLAGCKALAEEALQESAE